MAFVKEVEEYIADQKGIPTREELINLLKNEVVEVTFTKLNGDERTMPCTLKEDLLPPANKEEPLTQKKVRGISEAVIPVWVLDAQGFRSFRYDRVKKITVLDNFPIDKAP